MDKALLKQIDLMFAALNRQSAATAFPQVNALSNLLSPHCDPSGPSPVAAKPVVLNSFATAAVEMWLRSVHSF